MQIGIVSDTHDDLDAVHAAVELFESRNVDAVVHCGDFVAPFSAAPFDADFSFHAVRGNNDGEWALQSTVESFGTYHGEAAALSIPRDGDADSIKGIDGNGHGKGDGKGDGDGADDGNDGTVDVAVTHGTSGIVVDALVDCGDYDYVLHGHTHAHGVEERDGTVRVNPGGLPIPVAGADDAFRVATLDATERGAAAVEHHVIAE